MPPYTSFSFAGTVSLPVDTAATQGDGKHHASYDGIFPFDPKVVKWAAFCRGGGGGARDHLVLDTVQLKPVEGGSCTSSAAQPPSDPVAYEFYFGTAIPSTAGDGALLDDGTGYASGRSAGLTFGWNCDGNPDVDFSGGRRGLGRDGGLGINHFDRNGECPGPVNWEIEVPNGQCTSLARRLPARAVCDACRLQTPHTSTSVRTITSTRARWRALCRAPAARTASSTATSPSPTADSRVSWPTRQPLDLPAVAC